MRTSLRDQRVVPADENAFVRAEHNSAVHLLQPARESNDAHAERLPCKANEHESDGTETHDHNRIARADLALVEAAQNTGKRFGEGGVAIIEARRDEVSILLDD